MSPAPHTIHQETSRKIVFELMNVLDDAKSGEHFYAPTDGVLSDSNIIQSNILLITGENLHNQRKVHSRRARSDNRNPLFLHRRY